jgi:hypothetical protein
MKVIPSHWAQGESKVGKRMACCVSRPNTQFAICIKGEKG